MMIALRFISILFGVVLALVAERVSACAELSDINIAIPCPCVPGEDGITIGFFLDWTGKHHDSTPVSLAKSP